MKEQNSCEFEHIGIAVKNLKDAIKVYEALGLKVESIEAVEEQKVTTAFIPCGSVNLELLEAKFIEKRGEGIHHISIRVPDIQARLNELKENGIRLVDETPRKGAHNSKIAFIHPKAMKGVLIELCEKEVDDQ
jgi:methylmalonyl-CoA/ethylmalonyl-CoA epimerase